ncbi:hypothetical protein B0H14DRAFT_3481320 [Mycena olivaceomarginata]|nr:hypothetical protein B0H14DRAFT_3481320 [Mycena olivaceomarginata]
MLQIASASYFDLVAANNQAYANLLDAHNKLFEQHRLLHQQSSSSQPVSPAILHASLPSSTSSSSLLPVAPGALVLEEPKDYPHVRFWTRGDYKSSKPKNKVTTMNSVPGKRGGSRAAKDINVMHQYFRRRHMMNAIIPRYLFFPPPLGLPLYSGPSTDSPASISCSSMSYPLQYLFSRLKLLPIPRRCDHSGVHPTGSTSHKSCSWGTAVLKSWVKYLYGRIPRIRASGRLRSIPGLAIVITEPGPSLKYYTMLDYSPNVPERLCRPHWLAAIGAGRDAPPRTPFHGPHTAIQYYAIHCNDACVCLRSALAVAAP